jgi:hypothetical protein
MVAKRHHFVPKCYLEAFCVQGDKKKASDIYVFDAVERKEFRTSPENIALQNDFNTIDLEGHKPDAFELAMASVESDIGPALIRIMVAKSLANEDDRTLLLNLIGLLHIRNPRLRERFRQFRDRVARVILDIALSSRKMWESQIQKAVDAGYVSQDADTDYDKMKEGFHPDDYRIEVPNEENIRTEMDTFDHSLPYLFDRKWVLLKAPAHSAGFVTCDHPVSLTWSEPDPKRRNSRIGLRLKGTEILFPVSPQLAVLGAYELENGECEISEEQVASCNGTTILNSRRQVYARTMSFTYQIDQNKPPRKASELLEDDRFKPTL